mmetsp:Transcript_109131/g.319414  ORF Transcript_109131/g.319414 Transcript_109131/m.319414 type:complete len:218 (+) Transcript_109131:252-905(+)
MSRDCPPSLPTTSSGLARRWSSSWAQSGQFREHAAESADMPPSVLWFGSALRDSSSEATSLKPMEHAHCKREQPLYLASHQLGSMVGVFLSTSSGALCICSSVGPPSLRIKASASSFLPSPTSSVYFDMSKSGFTSMGCCISCISSASGRWLLFLSRMFCSVSSSCSGQNSFGLTSWPVELSMIMPAPAFACDGCGFGLSGTCGSGPGSWKSAGGGF